jgi:hypothetical protein
MAPFKFGINANNHLRDEIARRWQQLTTSEIEVCCTDQSKLIDILQSRYGYSTSRAEKEVDLFFGEFQNRIRMAA